MTYKTLKIVVCLIFTSLFAKAQTSAQLDAKNGFNKFVLGSTLREVAQIASITKTDNGSQYDAYTVKNPGSFKLFGYSPNLITLEFYGNLLTRIFINLPRPKTLNEDIACTTMVLNNYSSMYGDWTDLEASGNMLVQKAISGDKAILFYFLYKDSYVSGDTYCYMSVPLMQLSTGN